jgi:hypothetical protein
MIEFASLPAGHVRVAAEFPHLRLGDGPCDVTVRSGWLDSAAAVYALDAEVARARSLAIGEERLGLPVLSRYQRLFPRRNRHASTPDFDEVLRRHRSLHDLSRPLVQADYAHALDVWQWLLRLSPEAELPLQVAALFHDVERLRSEAEVRIEQHAPDYDAFKEAHAKGGAALACRCLDGAVDAAVLRRVAQLILVHERPAGALLGEAQLLADADALSFFSLNSVGFLDYFGPEHTAKKVAWTLGRMSPAARLRLPHLGLSPPIAALVSRRERLS